MAFGSNFLEQLLEISDRKERAAALRTAASFLAPAEYPELAGFLKDSVIAFLHKDAGKAIRTAELALDLADWTGDPLHRALGYRLLAQTLLLAYGETEAARAHYDRAIDLYETAGDRLGRAELAISHAWALMLSGDDAAAVREGEWGLTVLEEFGQDRARATLLNNLAMIHTRAGRLDQAMEMLADARLAYLALGEAGRIFLTNNAINRAFVLCDLGRFPESIQASEEALAFAERFQQDALLTRARHNLGLTFQILGHYNRALQLLETARQGWEVDGRLNESYQCDLALTYCLLQLQRFDEVVEVCERIRTYFQDREAGFERAQTYLNQAEAEIGLGIQDKAYASLAAGKEIFRALGNRYWAARADLIAASIRAGSGDWDECIRLSQACRAVFVEVDAPADEAAAILQVARAHLARGDIAAAEEHAQAAQTISLPRGIAALNYQIHDLLGQAAQAQDRLESAAGHYRRGLEELERLQSRMMVEHRPDFLEDARKRGLYEAAVSVSLALDHPLEALNVIERAKSRALLDILTHRIDLRVRRRGAADAALVDEFNRLLRERNRLARNLDRTQPGHVSGPADADMGAIRALERKIETLRRRWLVETGDYADRPELLRPPDVARTLADLDESTAMVEYFVLDGRPVAFLVHSDRGRVRAEPFQLDTDLRALQKLDVSLRTNFNAAVFGDPRYLPELTARAQALLQGFHARLLGPFAGRLDGFAHLVVVPYGPLHYLPFHAFHDGVRYRIEQQTVSYLPGAGFWSPPDPVDGEADAVVAVGYSHAGRLPQAVEEARAIAGLWGAPALIEEAATLEAVRAALSESRLFHCASHAEFRPDNPLFSGIALADGLLTTLDFFNLRIPASLVTLSACRTGRSALGGGDELLGFIRALLSAGASSLLLSQWEVEDRSTAAFMEAFYRDLLAGASKSVALQKTQKWFLRGESPDSPGYPEGKFRHPYFWASFYLVGNTGTIGFRGKRSDAGNTESQAY